MIFFRSHFKLQNSISVLFGMCTLYTPVDGLAKICITNLIVLDYAVISISEINRIKSLKCGLLKPVKLLNDDVDIKNQFRIRFT